MYINRGDILLIIVIAVLIVVIIILVAYNFHIQKKIEAFNNINQKISNIKSQLII